MAATAVKNTNSVLRFEHSEALLRNVMECAGVGMILLGLDLKLRYANRAFGSMLGYEPDECNGHDVIGFLADEGREAARDRMLELITSKDDFYRAERQYQRKDGSLIWMLASVSMVRNEKTGVPTHMVVQLVDIDRQKQAEEALAQSESRWNYALEAARQGVWDHDIINDKMFYSRMWREMRGFEDDEEIDGSQELWIERMHPDDRDRILSVIEKQDAGEEGHDVIEYRERHRDGHYVWIQSRGRPVEWDENGVSIRTLGTDTDISALKAIQAELAEGQERLSITLDSIGDGVISTDDGRCITFMNPIAELMTGWSETDAIGLPVDKVFKVVIEATNAPAPDPVAEALMKKDKFRVKDDLVLVGKNGLRHDISETATPVRTIDGRIIGAVLVFQDVTVSRALQRRLSHAASHDSLTGLPNRAAFERRLEEACDQARKENREHALCFIDLDRFKAVNDSSGHAAGDALLQKVAEIIRSCCRSKDFLARIGGDEFTLFLPDCSIMAAQVVAEKIVEAVGGLEFTWIDKVHRIGASIGVVSITHTANLASSPLAQADAACYAAKANGRNCVAIYDSKQPPSVTPRKRA